MSCPYGESERATWGLERARIDSDKRDRTRMDIGTVDLWATHYRSWLHSATLAAKVVLVVAVLCTVMLADHFLLLLATYAFVLALLLTTPLPVVTLSATSLYTVLFVAVFAVSRWDGTWLTPLTIVPRLPPWRS